MYYSHLNANLDPCMTYNQKSEVLNKCCNPDDIYYICLTDFHNKFPVHNSDRYSHVALCQQDMTDSLFSQVQSRKGKIHDMVGIYFVLDKFLRGIYLHMSHQTSKKVFCLDTLSKLWHSNKLYKVGDNFCTSPHQDIDPKDNLGHSVLYLSNNNQDGKYHIFAERNICCKHEHSAYIHY